MRVAPFFAPTIPQSALISLPRAFNTVHIIILANVREKEDNYANMKNLLVLRIVGEVNIITTMVGKLAFETKT